MESAVSSKLEDLRRAVAQNPGSAPARLRLGMALYRRGCLKPAQEELQRAVEIDDGYVEAWVNLGGVLMASLDFLGCVEANRKAAECDPSCVLAHYNRGLGHMYRGEAAQMEECFARVLQLDAQNPGGHYHLAVAKLALGKTDEARAALAVSIQLGWTPEPEFLKALEREDSGQVLAVEFGPKEQDDSTTL